jgi:hypothetical protein
VGWNIYKIRFKIFKKYYLMAIPLMPNKALVFFRKIVQFPLI